MHFKNPAIFYFLLALIIPIIIHLYQRKRFHKVVFSNVHFLKKIDAETRKSSLIKKILLLSTRLLCFLAILFTFSQPYFGNKKINSINHTFIYLDNSLSINTNSKNGNILQLTVQEIIEHTKEGERYYLLTNDEYFSNITKNQLDKELKKVNYSANNSNINEKIQFIEREINNKTNDSINIFLISDFQYFKKNKKIKFTNVNTPYSLVKLQKKSKNNISIDSILIGSKNSSKNLISVLVKNQGTSKNNIAIAIYNNSNLINKRSFNIDENEIKTIEFTIDKTKNFKGKIKITSNDTFLFDNTFYFTTNTTNKIPILAIGPYSTSFTKIFTDDEFAYKNTILKNIDYNSIPKQQLIILNELVKIPTVLQKNLSSYIKNGGHLVVIPNKEIQIGSYNSFLNKISSGSLNKNKKNSLKITDINFQHPLFKEVFLKEVKNFQYPSVTMSYEHNIEGDKIISYENNSPFLLQIKNPNSKIYLFSSPIDIQSSNFTNSPLIVPTLYAIGLQSFKISKPFYTLNQENTIEISKKIDKDQIISISNHNESFIPLQKSYSNKVTLITKETPKNAGFYNISLQKDTLETIAYNISSKESLLYFDDLKTIEKNHKNIKIYDSVKDLFDQIHKKNKVQWLWKLFLTIAIVSLLLEILILKFFRT